MAFKKTTYQLGEDARLNLVEPIRSKQDIARIINFFEKRGWYKYAVIFKFGIYTGLRISDILSLKVKDVRDKKRIYLREQKTGKIKNFPLKQELCDMLNEYCKNKTDEELVFTGRQNLKLDRTQVYRRINDAIIALGISANVGTHTLRKTFGYHCFRQFNNMPILQEILNHTSAEVTKRYIGITQDEIDFIYENLNLELDSSDLEGLVRLGNSKYIIRAVDSFCKNYIKNTGHTGIHNPFAQIILEIIHNPRFRNHKN